MPSGSKLGWVVTALLTVGVGLEGWHLTEMTGRREQTRTRSALIAEELTHLRARHEELSRQAVPAEELDKRRAEHTLIAQIREELATLQKKTDETPAPVEAAPALPPDITQAVVPPAAWRNMGRATPSAATETALWASAHGEIDKLAELLELDPGARRKAEEVMAGLAPNSSPQPETPEQWIARLTAQDIPQGGAGILNGPGTEQEFSSTRVQLENAEGASRKINLIWRRHGDAWSLYVQPGIVENYAAKLSGLPLPHPPSPWKP